MSRFLLRRAASSLILLWAILTLAFCLLHAAPGDPVALMTDTESTDSELAHLRERFGLDRPVGVQYLAWLGSILRGDLGVSLSRHRPVAEILAEAVPQTLRLTGLAFLLHFLVGTVLALWSVARRGRADARAGQLAALVLYSLPAFWLGLLLQLLFSQRLGWLPSGGLPGAGLAEQVRHLLMPVFVLGVASAAPVARLMRSSLLEVLREDYIRTAFAKGLSERSVLLRHALRPASVSLATLMGLGIPFLLSGSVAIEVVFGWPGMGRVTVDAIFARDYPLVLATTALSAMLVILGNFIADLAYVAIDPRVRLTA